MRLRYTARNGRDYVFTLIDTPAMSISLRGQPLAPRPARARCCWSTRPRAWRRRPWPNAYQAIEADHEIVPVLNKIDLPAAEPDRIKQQIEDIIGLEADNALMISAKTGLGVEAVLEAIVERLPPPQGEVAAHSGR